MMKSINRTSWLLCSLIALLAARVEAQVTIDKRITIQPIYVSDGSTTANAGQVLFEAETDKIWSQAGIDILFLPGINYTYSNSTFVSGGGRLSSNAPDPNSLLSLYQTTGESWSTGTLSTNIVRLFFVQNIDGDSGVLGFTIQTNVANGFFPPGEPFFATNGYAMAVSDSAINIYNRRDVIAHELGHALGLDHDTMGAGSTAGTAPYSSINNNPALNLMSSGNVRTAPTFLGDIYPTGAGTDQMTGSVVTNNWSSVPTGNLVWNPDNGPVYQIDTVRISPTAANITPFVYSAIPEPATNAAIAGAVMLVLAGYFRRQRTKA